MTYNQFKAQIADCARAHFPDDTDISIHPVTRNNSTVLDSLSILERGSSISPNIYLNAFYEAYQEGESLEDIMQQILLSYRARRITVSPDMTAYQDFDYVRPRLAIRLINTRRNLRLLEEIPHIDWLDLSIIFAVQLGVIHDSEAAIIVRDEHTHIWGDPNAEELFQIARANMPRLAPATFESIGDLLAGDEPMRSAMREEQLDVPEPENWETEPPEQLKCGLFAVSNRSHLNGASAILYSEDIQRFADRVSSDLIVFPSSIHEVLITPYMDSLQQKSLDRLVREVNDSVVDDDEVLSDHAYYYDRTSHTVLMSIPA